MDEKLGQVENESWDVRDEKHEHCGMRMKRTSGQKYKKYALLMKNINITTGERSPAITPYHTYHFSISTSLTFITSKLPSQDDFHHLITFTTR